MQLREKLKELEKEPLFLQICAIKREKTLNEHKIFQKLFFIDLDRLSDARTKNEKKKLYQPFDCGDMRMRKK